jgi:amino-acid N-acetyltransferase
MEIVNAKEHREAVIALLQGAKLPIADLPEELDEFLAIWENDQLIGVAGMEQYSEYALLRSVAVASSYRNKGIAGVLLKAMERRAASKQVKAIYLLTETAPMYFLNKGFETVNRDDVPEALKQSSEFNHVCPVSAIVMKKVIVNNHLA